MADDTNSQSILARMTDGYAKREENRIGQVVNDVLDAGRRAMDRARMFVEGAPASEKRAYNAMTRDAQQEKREWRKMSPEQIRDRLQSTTAAVTSPRPVHDFLTGERMTSAEVAASRKRAEAWPKMDESEVASSVMSKADQNQARERIYREVDAAYVKIRMNYSSNSPEADYRNLETMTSIRNEVARAFKSDGVVNTAEIASADAKLGREWTKRLSDAGVTLVERSTRPTLQPGGWPDVDDVRKARAENRPMELAGEDKLSAGVRAYINSGAPKQETHASLWKSEKREASVPVQVQQRRMSV